MAFFADRRARLAAAQTQQVPPRNIGAPATLPGIQPVGGRGTVLGGSLRGALQGGIGIADRRNAIAATRVGPGGQPLQPGQYIRADGRVMNADGSSAAVAATPDRTIREAIAGQEAQVRRGGRDVGAVQAREAVIQRGTPARAAITAPPLTPARISPFRRFSSRLAGADGTFGGQGSFGGPGGLGGGFFGTESAGFGGLGASQGTGTIGGFDADFGTAGASDTGESEGGFTL